MKQAPCTFAIIGHLLFLNVSHVKAAGLSNKNSEKHETDNYILLINIYPLPKKNGLRIEIPDKLDEKKMFEENFDNSGNATIPFTMQSNDTSKIILQIDDMNNPICLNNSKDNVNIYHKEYYKLTDGINKTVTFKLSTDKYCNFINKKNAKLEIDRKNDYQKCKEKITVDQLLTQPFNF